jgi:hypothetical protein
MKTSTTNISAHIAGIFIRLVSMIQKNHRFLLSVADIDFAENVLRVTGGGRNVPLTIVQDKIPVIPVPNR